MLPMRRGVKADHAPQRPLAKFDLGQANLYCFSCGHLVTVAKDEAVPKRCPLPGRLPPARSRSGILQVFTSPGR